jgi:hypothetical protein
MPAKKAKEVYVLPEDDGPSTPEEGETRTAPTPQSIAARAFIIYLERGSAHGRDVEDWIQAERELQGA